MNIQITKFLFLRGLPEIYESAHQTLKSQDMTMKEMILRLTETESRMRFSNKIEHEHANKARAEWIKSAKCYNYNKKRHIAKFCRTPKKNQVKKNDKKDNKKDENEASDDKKCKKNQAV